MCDVDEYQWVDLLEAAVVAPRAKVAAGTKPQLVTRNFPVLVLEPAAVEP